jgi:hypothetical protein
MVLIRWIILHLFYVSIDSANPFVPGGKSRPAHASSSAKKNKNERDGLKRTFQTLHPANTQRKNPTPVPVRLELFVSVS